MNENKNALAIGTELNSYKIDSVIADDDFCIVYKAQHMSLDSIVVIKEYLPSKIAVRDGNQIHPLSGSVGDEYQDGLTHFLSEAKELVQLKDSQNIASCRDLFSENGTAYLVMDYENGLSLNQLLRTQDNELLKKNETVNTLGEIEQTVDEEQSLIGQATTQTVTSNNNIFVLVASVFLLAVGIFYISEIVEERNLKADAIAKLEALNKSESEARAAAKEKVELEAKAKAKEKADAIQRKKAEAKVKAAARKKINAIAKIKRQAKKHYDLAVKYRYGDGVTKDLSKSARYLHKSAEQGNAAAQSDLGVSYNRGAGVEKNLKKANYWTRKSAEQGNSNAQNDLGLYYWKGGVVEKDFKKAIYWIRKSANNNNMYAQFQLGQFYLQGIILVKDYKKAAYWNEKSAKQGYWKAANDLAYQYSTGKGVVKNKNQEMFWRQRAIRPR